MRICLVTGASRGIGAAVARRLAGVDTVVCLNHRDSAAQAEAVRAVIQQAGGAAAVFQADVADASAVGRMFHAIQDQFGQLDVLIHNAAPPLVPRSILKLDWDRDVTPQVDTAGRGFLHCVQAAAPLLTKSATIVVLLTDALFHKPMVQMGAYLAAKGCLLGLARAAAKEFQRKGVSVNFVSPGMTQTDLLRHYGERAVELLAQEHPLSRAATPEEVADAVAVLANKPNAFLHGANVIINGGSDF
jgi:3-oxoacyl-[acyl-carrier protein] reductase